MAVKTWFATSSLASVHQAMSETDPGTEAFASPVTGWVVGTTGTGTGAFNSQTESSTFSGTNPDGTIDTTNGDCLRTTDPYTGDFASGNWTVNFCCRSQTNVAGQGRMLCRLFRGANADGSGATEITAAAQTGSTVTMSTTVTQNSSVTFNPGAFSVDNEYIFVQLAWGRITAGGMSSADVNMRIGNSANLGTRVVSSDLAVTISGTLAVTEDASDTAAFSGLVGLLGDLAVTEVGSDDATFAGELQKIGTLAVTEVGDTADIAGEIVLVVSGQLTVTEVALINWVPSPEMEGAAVGSVGDNGPQTTLPDGWESGVNDHSGVSVDVVGTGTENGQHYLDLRVHGTYSGTPGGGNFTIWLGPASDPDSGLPTSGLNYTLEFAMHAGFTAAAANLCDVSMFIGGFDSGNAFLGTSPNQVDIN